jgi:outer membrane protein assembly factor BamC
MNRLLMHPVFAIAAAFALAACSSDSNLLESKRVDYKSAKPSSTLEVPPDLTAPRTDDRYAVPDIGSGARGSATYSDYSADRAAQPAPGSTGVLTGSNNMRIERAGSQRWLVVEGTAEKIWPQLRDFWTDLGFSLNIDAAEIGVLETDWRENRANLPQGGLRKLVGKVLDGMYSTSQRDKFRTRLERGEDGVVEIYISHRGMEESFRNETTKDSTVWHPRPADPELEAEMLRRLMVRLGADEVRAKNVLVEAQRADRAQVQVISDETLLQVDEPFDRAWRRVGLALDRVNFTVEDRDRSKGLYYVRYVDPEIDSRTKKGFFSKLFSSEEKREGGQYRLFVEGKGSQSIVTVLSPEGGADQSPTARRILTLLQQELR